MLNDLFRILLINILWTPNCDFVELMANALDAKASEIKIMLSKDNRILEATDNGLGMDKRQFREYHDFDASTKRRGKGIGFAGQGAKLALNFLKKFLHRHLMVS